MNKIELLAPVGNYEAFISAINNGADAIYVAGEHFGAREKATFSNEELQKMIKYAHVREVRVHVVINTLIYDDEIDKVMEFVDFLYNNDVDAIIVQDLGIITLVHNIYPDLEIHASTQLNTLNYKQAKVLKKLGVKRIIMAREASLTNIKDIIEKVDIDIEVFAHGALCMGYSGQCLLSSFTAKKSGNRGECLQLCRLPYSFLVNDNKVQTNGDYLLSCKDLNTLDKLGEFIDSGVISLKIEGRVKSASYVGKVVSLYRKYIDEYYKNKTINIANKDTKDLKKVFNREFTKGYVFGEKSRDIVNTYRPNNIGVRLGEIVKIERNKAVIKLSEELHQGDGIRFIGIGNDNGMIVNKMYLNGLLVSSAKTNDYVTIELKCDAKVKDTVYKTSDYLLNKEIENNNTIITKRFPINIVVKAFVGKHLSIVASDELNNKVLVESDYIIDLANKTPTSRERIKEQIAKLNDSVYYLNDFKIESDDMIIIPISVINHLRNDMIQALNAKREIRNTRKGKQELNLVNIDIHKEDFSYLYKVSNKEQYEIIKKYSDVNSIYFNSKECIYAFPRISYGTIIPSNNLVLLNELSDIDDSKYMIANTYLNTTNIYSLYTLYKLGFKRVTLSLEMGLSRIKNLVNNYQQVFGVKPNIEVIVYGKIDLMITKHCPINKVLTNADVNCNRCKEDEFALMDRKGYKLELIKDGLCNIRILNPKKLHLIDYCKELENIGVSKLRIEFTTETKEEVEAVINGYKNGNLTLLGVTRGYFSDDN